MDKAQKGTLAEGPLTPKIIKFIIPLMLSGILQLAYNMADSIVVGRWEGENALAAVTSVGALINLMINVFMGLATGASVCVAHDFGAKDDDGVQKTVHTSIFVSMICGLFVAVFGVICSETFLIAMDSPEEVLPLSTLYLRIYFLGAPANMIYNFGAAILRSVGDTKRPLYFLTFSGLINVVLNIVFVVLCKMGVAGVALSTVISQYISAFLVMTCLMRQKDCTNFSWKKLRIHKEKLKKMVIVGLPAGLQGSVFSLANVVIQSSVNSFGSFAMAGSGAAGNLEGFTYNAMNSVYHASLTFVGQNVGAKKYDRINAVVFRCVIIVTVIGLLFGFGTYIFREQLLALYIKDSAEAFEFGSIRLMYVVIPYFFCGIMEVMVGGQRGMGMSIIPMITSVVGSCALRILWIKTIFAVFHTPGMLFIVYPLSWFVTSLTHTIFYSFRLRKIKNEAKLTENSRSAAQTVN